MTTAIHAALDFVDSSCGRSASMVASVAGSVLLIVNVAMALWTFGDRTLSALALVVIIVPTAVVLLWNLALTLRHGERYRKSVWGIRLRRFRAVLPRRVRFPLYAVVVSAVVMAVVARVQRPGAPGYDSAVKVYSVQRGQHKTPVSWDVYRHAVAVDQRLLFSAFAAALAWALLVSLFHLRIAADNRVRVG